MNDFSGLIPDLDIQDYHSGPGISKSGLDKINESPYVFWAHYINPKRPPYRSKGGQLEGSLAHCSILEPDEFSNRYAVAPTGLRKGTNDFKAWERSISDGMEAITLEQYEAAMQQAENARAHPVIGHALNIGKAETSAFWKDAKSGQLCKCRPDLYAEIEEDQVIIFDVKTFNDVSSQAFAKQIARKRYDVQAAYYTDGFARAAMVNVISFIFIAVQSDYPHQVRAFKINDEGLESGRVKYRRDLDLYAQCKRTNDWPGHNEVEEIALPRWSIET